MASLATLGPSGVDDFPKRKQVQSVLGVGFFSACKTDKRLKIKPLVMDTREIRGIEWSNWFFDRLSLSSSITNFFYRKNGV